MIKKRKLRLNIMCIFKHNKFERGFTLVEVVISTLIIGIILSSIFYALGFLNINLDYSATKKGETLLDTLRNLEAMHCDMFIVRHPSSGAAEFISKNVIMTVANLLSSTINGRVRLQCFGVIKQ